MNKPNLYSLPQAVVLIGQPYDRVRYAANKGVVKPLTFGKARLFTTEQIENLKHYFTHKKGSK